MMIVAVLLVLLARRQPPQCPVIAPGCDSERFPVNRRPNSLTTGVGAAVCPAPSRSTSTTAHPPGATGKHGVSPSGARGEVTGVARERAVDRLVRVLDVRPGRGEEGGRVGADDQPAVRSE